jgi:glucokinase
MSDEPSLLRSLDKITSKDVYEAAKEGDKLAIKIFEYTGTVLGEKLADFIEFSAPEAIVLFGGLARSKEFLTEPITKAMNANVPPLWRGKVKLVYSQLKESDAAILGASALAWEL